MAQHIRTLPGHRQQHLNACTQIRNLPKKHAERKRKELLGRCKDKEFCARRDKAAAEANKKPIICITTGELFPSKNEAAKELGISVSLISKQMRGLPTRTNLQWKFVDG